VLAIMNNSSRGFTLIEALVVIAMVAILLGVAAPSLVAFQRNSELRASANGFLAAMQMARAEAMKRRVDTYVVPVSATGWASGWTVFADSNFSGSTYNAASDTLILQTGAISSKTSVVTNTSAQGFPAAAGGFAIRFNGSGFPVNASGAPVSGAVQFNSVGSTEIRRVVLTLVGRARVCDPAKDTTVDCSQ
jgi:type IV fimbrial biogenesis protein FimT